MDQANHFPEACLLLLPAELRLLIYAHLTAPAPHYHELKWDEWNRRSFLEIVKVILPATKLNYFTLHALGASCSMLRSEVARSIDEVRAMLAKQKYYCGFCAKIRKSNLKWRNKSNSF